MTKWRAFCPLIDIDSCCCNVGSPSSNNFFCNSSCFCFTISSLLNVVWSPSVDAVMEAVVMEGTKPVDKMWLGWITVGSTVGGGIVAVVTIGSETDGDEDERVFIPSVGAVALNTFACTASIAWIFAVAAAAATKKRLFGENH